jgi:2-methylisocitrate lyase-like PEP mutase family enzyme
VTVETSAGSRFRALLRAREVVITPGASDPLTARLIERAGFPAVYVTGAGIANAFLGVPDVGLTTLTEVATAAARIVDRVTVPVFADADTGFGGVGSVQRTVREFERAGLAGLHIEDQTMPKRCGHFDGKSVVPMEEMVLRVHAALEARQDDDFVIIARTDARAVEGLDSALERAALCVTAGVDMIFVEGLVDEDEFRIVGRELAGVPLIANMVEGGKSPLIPAARLSELGFQIVLYANLALRLGALAIKRGLDELREQGTSAGMLDQILPWEERQTIVGLGETSERELHLLDLTEVTMADHRSRS